ncbi:MAG: hypothetical protein QGI45_08185, partial [Myxococcota bacterium]|nr:hypothetical protein [Myxococcota bacterium]
MSLRKNTFLNTLGALICLVVAACVLLEAVPTPEGNACNVSYDCLCLGCEGNQQFGCDGGMCSSVCNRGAECLSGMCLRGYCQSEPECEVDDDCDSGNACVTSQCNKGMCNETLVNCPLAEGYCSDTGYVSFSRFCLADSGCGLEQQVTSYAEMQTDQATCQETVGTCNPESCAAAAGQCQIFLECGAFGCRYALRTHGAQYSALCHILDGSMGVCAAGVCRDPANITAENTCNPGGGVQDAEHDGSSGNVATCSGENVTVSGAVSS